MTNPTTSPSPDALALLAARQAYGELPDRYLLDRFATNRDEAAFAALVERHGIVVLDVARAILRQAEDAEDVFQAAFLVLALKAEAIRKRDAIGSWLYGVTRRIALKVLRARARRARHEAVARMERESTDNLAVAEVRAHVHEELARLPESLRAPVLLCHLEGLTLDEASARLEIPRGTLRGRLDRAREVLRGRLARWGLSLAELASVPAATSAVALPTVVATARACTRHIAGVGESSRAAALAKGAMSMKATYSTFCLLLAVAFGIVGLGVAGPRKEDPAPAPAPREGAQPGLDAKQPVVATPKVEFEEVSATIRHSFRSNLTRETIRVSADGTCIYEIPERPARGDIPAWPPGRILHKLPPNRLGELNTLIKGTDWLTKDPKAVMQLHQDEFTLAVKRDGEKIDLTIKGESVPYGKLLHFFRSLAAQEYIQYRLEWVPSEWVEARRDVDNLVAAELGEPFEKPTLAIDLARYAPWAKRLVRDPFNKSADDVRAAVRLVGLLKLESEREYLADLANDRSHNVRAAVVIAIGRLGGEKAVPVLRKMLRGAGPEAGWELIKLGDVAVPTIVDVIREGPKSSEDVRYEWLIRAYIEHWKSAPKPLSPKILDAVRVSMKDPNVKALRIVYHAELLKLAGDANDTKKRHEDRE